MQSRRCANRLPSCKAVGRAMSPRGARLAAVLTVLAFAVGLPCQTTWIVDANNGPGTNFTDLPPAVQAAAPGDTIIVRGNGIFTGGTISKGVQIVGEGVVVPLGIAIPVLTLPFQIDSIPPGETLVLSNVRFQNLVILKIEINNCAGAVVFNDVAFRNGYFSFDNCASVWLDSCDLHPAYGPTTFKNSSVLIQNTDIIAELFGVSDRAIYSENSHLRIVDSHIKGPPDFNQVTWVGIYCGGTTIEVAGTSIIEGGFDIPTQWQACGIKFFWCGTNPSTVIVAPTATIKKDCSFLLPPNCHTRTDRPIPALAATTLDPPNPLVISHYGHPSSLQFLFYGAPASTPITLPFGDIWLAPPLTNILVGYLGIVSLGPTGSATTTWTVPPTIPRGQPFAIQAVELKTNGTFETTIPGITLRQ